MLDMWPRYLLSCLISAFALTAVRAGKFYCHPVCEHRCLPTCKLQCCLPPNENPLHRSYIGRPMPMHTAVVGPRSVIRHPGVPSLQRAEERILRYILYRRGLTIPRSITAEELEQGESCASSCQVECKPNCKFRCCLRREALPMTSSRGRKEDAARNMKEEKEKALTLLLRRSKW